MAWMACTTLVEPEFGGTNRDGFIQRECSLNKKLLFSPLVLASTLQQWTLVLAPAPFPYPAPYLALGTQFDHPTIGATR